ncbi:MAG: hypothetical protein WC705_00255 [Candidatus Paceibacterota bacterium]|jgi:hypothetical protein
MDYFNVKHFKEMAGYDIDGIWYPRVTKIVDIKAKPALYKFYAEMNSFAQGEDIKAKSASEGTLIHETVEALLIGNPPAGGSLDPSIKPAIDAFVEFIDKNKIQVDPELIEKRVVNYDERYAGTLDAMAIINGKFGVLDIKTSQSIYRDYNLQTSAYMGALEKDFPTLQTRWILRIDQNKICYKCEATLRPKGGRDKIRLAWNAKDKSVRAKSETCEHEWSDLRGEVELKEFPYWKDDFKAFLGAKKLWEWENEFWLKQVGYF